MLGNNLGFGSRFNLQVPYNPDARNFTSGMVAMQPTSVQPSQGGGASALYPNGATPPMTGGNQPPATGYPGMGSPMQQLPQGQSSVNPNLSTSWAGQGSPMQQLPGTAFQGAMGVLPGALGLMSKAAGGAGDGQQQAAQQALAMSQQAAAAQPRTTPQNGMIQQLLQRYGVMGMV